MLRFMNVVVICLVAGSAWGAPSGTITRVVDGDGFYVGQTEVRLHGVDAVELNQTCVTEQNSEWACGTWVRAQVAQRFEGRKAQCETVTTDRYGRAVATCEVDGQDVGRTLVSEGLAFAYRRYSMAYDLDEKAAAVNDRGLHAHRVQNPSWVRKTRAKGRIPVDPNCAIKGNISLRGTKIFHVPGQRDYESTGIRTEKGERWFCSEDAALAAGWRKAKR